MTFRKFKKVSEEQGIAVFDENGHGKFIGIDGIVNKIEGLPINEASYIYEQYRQKAVQSLLAKEIIEIIDMSKDNPPDQTLKMLRTAMEELV